MFKSRRSSFLCLAFMCFALEACAEDKDAAAKAKPIAVPATAANNTNQIMADAKQKKVKESCLARVNNMSTFLVGSGQYSSMTYAAPKDADENLFSAVIGQQDKGGSYLAFMDMSPDDNCSATYDIVKVWANNCQQVAANTFPQHKVLGQMAGGAWAFELNANTHIFALESPGQGCVTIEKHMLFEQVKQ